MTTNRRTFLKGFSAAGTIGTIAPAILPIASSASVYTQTSAPALSYAHPIDFSGTSIYCPRESHPLVKKAVGLLQHRIQMRSGIYVPITAENLLGHGNTIVVGIEQELRSFQKNFQSLLGGLAPTAKEGYKIATSGDGKAV
jgi:hypothetical protein